MTNASQLRMSHGYRLRPPIVGPMSFEALGM
jgi:hypothetical protein